jgi:hypothetical protein
MLNVLIAKLKNLRNYLLLKWYLKKRPSELDQFNKSIQHLKGKSVAIVIAFEQPWTLNWLLNMAKKNLKNATVLVFDNSRTSIMRARIKSICKKNKIFYFSLPIYKTRHVNRSHGMAMSWIYEHIVKTLKPKMFAFIDHDLIPVSLVDFSKRIQSQPFYGRIVENLSGFWSLWAGYCLFDYQNLIYKKINFLYDFSRNLDTGGKNWRPLYAHYIKKDLSFASRTRKNISLPEFKDARSIEFIDDQWIHIEGVSYNNNFKERSQFFKALARQLKINSDWTRLLKK